MNIARWTIRARGDVALIDDRYRQIDPDLADRFGREALNAARFLATTPAAGPSVELGLRKWPVRHSEYLLFYRIVSGGVEIVRVRHARENWR